MRLTTLLTLSLLLSIACGDDDMTADSGVDMAPMDMGSDLGSDALADASPDASDLGMDAPDASDMGMATLCPTARIVLDPVMGAVNVGVVSSDFTSSAISLLDADGAVSAASWFDSGTAAPGLTAALGGDVVLSTAHPEGTLGVVDRFGTDVVTRFCISSGSLIGQLNVGADGFSANPQDMVVVGDRGFVSRYEQNPNSDAPAADRGSDLIGFDARTMMRNGERVDLAMFGDTVTGRDADGEVDVDIAPRPGRIVQVGDTLVVGLERLPVDLFGAARGFGEGAVALVSLDDLSVTGFPLTGLANCGQVVPVAGADDEVLVACKGYSNAGFGDEAGERATAGVVRIRVVGGAAMELSGWRAADDAESPLAVNSVASLGGADFAAVTFGTFGESGDSLWRFVEGEFEEILTSADAFALGQAALIGDVLFVPDASADEASIRRLRDVSGTPERLEPLIATDALPPRLVSAL